MRSRIMHWIASSEKDAAAEPAVAAPSSRLKSQECYGARPQGPVLGLIILRFAEAQPPFTANAVGLGWLNHSTAPHLQPL